MWSYRQEVPRLRRKICIQKKDRATPFVQQVDASLSQDSNSADGSGKRKHAYDNVIMEDADTELKKSKTDELRKGLVCSSQVAEVGCDQPCERQ